MPQRRLLIDLENVPTSDYTLLPPDFLVMPFIGSQQESVPLAFIELARAGRLEECKITNTGKNALDFHLAFYLGRLSCTDSEDEFVILSKDTGYDPLIKHLRTLNIRCKRVNTINDVLPKLTAPKAIEQKIINEALNPVNTGLDSETLYGRICENINKLNERPKTREELYAYVIAICKQGVSTEEREKVMIWLYRYNVVREENGKLIYCFPKEEKA